MRLLVVVALAVVLAGCGGLIPGGGTDAPRETTTATPPTTGGGSPTGATTPTASPTPTPRDSGKVSVSGSELPIDEEAVYRTVVALHGRSYADAPATQIRVVHEPSPEFMREDEVPEFWAVWGFRPFRDAPAPSGWHDDGLVTLNTAVVEAPTEREAVLAHEFTHVIQYETGAQTAVRRKVLRGDGNYELVTTLVVEGAAEYVETRYLAHVHDRPAEETTWAAVTANTSLRVAYGMSPYYFGERYVRQRVDSPANLSALYERPPTTTEQVIHGYGPDEEPARPLIVRTDLDGASGWYVAETAVRGELFLRLVLEAHLGPDRAARAAAGWGADRALTLYDDVGEAYSHAWVLRWDDATEAEEFAAAMTDYLDERGQRSDGRWAANGTAFDVRRASPETVVVLAGTSGFVRNASVGGAGGNVTVRVGG